MNNNVLFIYVVVAILTHTTCYCCVAYTKEWGILSTPHPLVQCDFAAVVSWTFYRNINFSRYLDTLGLDLRLIVHALAKSGCACLRSCVHSSSRLSSDWPSALKE